VHDLGRRALGISTLFLGAAELVNRDFASIWEPIPDAMPGRTAAAIATALLFIACGAGLQWRRTARAAAAVIALLYCVFVGLWLKRVIGFPLIFGTWGGMAEELAPCLAAFVLLLGSGKDEHPRLELLRLCCILYGLCVIAFGVNHFFAMTFTASMVPSWIPPGQWTWALLTGIFDVLGGIAVITGIFAITASRLLTLMYAGFGLLIWIPRMFSDPSTVNTWMGNGVNFSIIAAAWVFADLIKEREKEFTKKIQWTGQRPPTAQPG
jgi:uncharacterized membrane protein